MGGGNSIREIAGIFLFMCLGSGCMKVALQVERPLQSVAVIPFFIGDPSGEGKRFVKSPISGRLFVAGEIGPNSQGELTNLLYQKLSAFPKLHCVPLKEVEEAMKGEDFERDPIASAQKTGERFGVDGVLLGWVFRYEDRIGNAISVERPASVSFVLHLVGVKEGQILWSAPFQETQQALSENILKLTSFLRRRGTWLKAKGLANVGMDEILFSFPALRERPEPEGA